jgi:hypothetical protein
MPTLRDVAGVLNVWATSQMATTLHTKLGANFGQGAICLRALIAAANPLFTPPIFAKWLQLGGADGLLGIPRTPETTTPDGLGRFVHFDNGSIYWSSATGAHEIHGLIRDHWAQLGWEQGTLGYPISDEQPAGTDHRFSDFENGVVYWASGEPAAKTLKAYAGEIDSQTDLPFKAATVLAKITKFFTDTINSVSLPSEVSGIHIDIAPFFRTGVPYKVWILDVQALGGLDPIVNLPVTPYRADASRVINRRHKIGVNFTLVIPSSPNNIHVQLAMDWEIFLDPSNSTVTARLDHYEVVASGDWPFITQSSTDTAAATIKKALDAIKPVVLVQQQTPSSLVQSVKTMLDGDINVYSALLGPS